MGILDSLFEKKQATLPDSWVDFWPHQWLDSTKTTRIDHDTAITSTAVWNALVMIAGTIGSLPVDLLQKVGDNRREPVSGHSFNALQAGPANRWDMALSQVFEVLQGHSLVRGNGFAQKVRDNGEQIRELIPLHPAKVKVHVERDGLTYEVRQSDGPSRFLDSDDVLHVRGFSPTGILGYDPVGLLGRAIGLTLNIEKHADRMYKNAGRRPGAISTDVHLKREAKQSIKESWNEAFGGDDPLRTAVLDEGLKWQSLGMTAEEAQMAANRTFQIGEVSRAFNIAPHLLKDFSSAGLRANIEQQSLEFAIYTIRPWLRRWENALSISILTEAERDQGYFFRFRIEELVSADIQTRYDAYKTAWQFGWMTTNEIRALEDMNPIDDGDTTFVPLNMVPRDQAAEVLMPSGNGKALPGPSEGKATRDRRLSEIRLRSRAVLRAGIRSAADSLLQRELERGRRILERSGSTQEFLQWTRDFYKDYDEKVFTTYFPLLMSHASVVNSQLTDELGDIDIPEAELERFVEEYTRTMSRRWVSHSASRLENVAMREEDDPLAAVSEEYERWDDHRADTIADHESVRSDGALSRELYALAGVIALRWMTVGKNCPICNRLGGRIVGTREPFMSASETLDIPDAEPFVARRMMTHPPAHSHCDCYLLSAPRLI